MEKTTLYLSADIQRSLRLEARRTGRPQAELVREALRAYLERRPDPEPCSIGSGSDKKLAGRDSEAWLRRRWDKRR
jgi:hypothetical protein